MKETLESPGCKTFTYNKAVKLEFVTGGVELLKAVLHGYAGGLIFMK